MAVTRSSTKSWSDLPFNVLLVLLQHVDVFERLSVCSLVSRKWAEAATRATTSIQWSCLDKDDEDRFNDLTSWLATHGTGVTSLNLWFLHPRPEIRYLPCQHLLDLHLEDCCVLLGAELRCEPGLGGALPGSATGLTKLSVHGCEALGVNPYKAIGALTNLQDLSLASNSLESYHEDGPGPFLQPLTKLTRLHWVNSNAVYNNTLDLSCFTHLQELDLAFADVEEGNSIPGLGQLQHLTYLQLKNTYAVLSKETLGTVAGAAPMFKMQHLRLHSAGGLDPVVLRSMTRLQCLNLQETPLLGAGSAAERITNFLSSMACIRELHTLIVDGELLAELSTEVAQYSALTASTKLQRLKLHNCQMSATAWANVFQAGTQLPYLTSLCLDAERGLMTASTRLPASVLPQLARSCPALVELSLWNNLQIEETLECTSGVLSLARLSTLQRLEIQLTSGASSTCVLSQLTSLTQLRLGFRKSASTLEDVVPWTQCSSQLSVLKTLEKLHTLYVETQQAPDSIVSVGWDDTVCGDCLTLKRPPVKLMNKAREGRPSDIHHQVQALSQVHPDDIDNFLGSDDWECEFESESESGSEY